MVSPATAPPTPPSPSSPALPTALSADLSAPTPRDHAASAALTLALAVGPVLAVLAVAGCLLRARVRRRRLANLAYLTTCDSGPQLLTSPTDVRSDGYDAKDDLDLAVGTTGAAPPEGDSGLRSRAGTTASEATERQPGERLLEGVEGSEQEQVAQEGAAANNSEDAGVGRASKRLSGGASRARIVPQHHGSQRLVDDDDDSGAMCRSPVVSTRI